MSGEINKERELVFNEAARETVGSEASGAGRSGAGRGGAGFGWVTSAPSSPQHPPCRSPSPKECNKSEKSTIHSHFAPCQLC